MTPSLYARKPFLRLCDNSSSYSPYWALTLGILYNLVPLPTVELVKHWSTTQTPISAEHQYGGRDTFTRLIAFCHVTMKELYWTLERRHGPSATLIPEYIFLYLEKWCSTDEMVKIGRMSIAINRCQWEVIVLQTWCIFITFM